MPFDISTLDDDDPDTHHLVSCDSSVEPAIWLLVVGVAAVILLSPVQVMVTIFLVTGYRVLDDIVNLMFGERFSPGGSKLGLMGRINVNRLWTDDPKVAQEHAEQDERDRLAGRFRLD